MGLYRVEVWGRYSRDQFRDEFLEEFEGQTKEFVLLEANEYIKDFESIYGRSAYIDTLVKE